MRSSGLVIPAIIAAAMVLLLPVATRATEHVYVADAGAGKIFRFPVRAGILAQRPDAALDVPISSLGIAVAADGTMYVADGADLSILVYRAGAHGHAQPIQTIAVPIAPINLVVDANGYVFARLTATNGISTVVGIAPSGTITTTIDNAAASTLSLDPQGNLYVGFDHGFDVYATPETSPTIIRSACLRETKSPISGLAVSPGGRIFLARIGYMTRVADRIDACPIPFGRYNMFVSDSPSFYLAHIVADGTFVFTVEVYRKRVLQLAPNKARQVPLADVRYAGFQSPYGIAVGP